MRIGLIDVDGHNKKTRWGSAFPNLALMKISAFHKSQGDVVEWAELHTHYDILYQSKIFKSSPDVLEPYIADVVKKGGTGYDLTSALPDEIDRLQPDYSIYPWIKDREAYGFLTRGCPNKCKWCVVPKKEGAIRPYMDVDEIALHGKRPYLTLMDNNILAADDYAVEQLEKIIRGGIMSISIRQWMLDSSRPNTRGCWLRSSGSLISASDAIRMRRLSIASVHWL